MKYVSTSVADTERIAGELAMQLRGGECIALEGDLGAGKTQFTRGLVKALGGEGRLVSSPTYVLLHIYPTESLQVYHLDAYRVGGADDFEQIGFEELLDQNGVVMVEWASRVEELLPENHIRVRIETVDESQRVIEIDRR